MVIPRFLDGVNPNDAAIENHKATCGFCQEKIQKEKDELQAKADGVQKMSYCLEMIERAKEQIEQKYKQIDEEKRLKKENWELMVEHIKKEIPPLEYQLEWESKVELPKLLNDENEISRKAAKEIYDKYVQCSDKDKRLRRWRK